jgi:hypothetical protein
LNFARASEARYLILTINERFQAFDIKNLNNFDDINHHDSAIVAFQSTETGKFFIIWRHAGINYQLVVFDQIAQEDLKSLCLNLMEFLRECLANGESG